MDVRALRYFVEVAKQKSFTAAADRCFVTQPTLSRRIAELEDELGTALFIRSTRRVELSEKGLLLYHQAQAILSLIDRTTAEIKGAAELSGDLMISAAEVPAFRTVARAVKTFQTAHPRVRVHVTSTNGQAALLNLKTGVAHFAVLNAPVELAGLDYLELPEGARWGVLTRRDGRFAGRRSIGPADLADLPLFVPQHPLITSRLTGWLGFPADQLRVVGTYNLLNNMRYVVASGRECLCLSGIVEEDDVVMFLPLEPAMTTYSLFVWPASTVKDALVDAFRECVRREIEAEAKRGAQAEGTGKTAGAEDAAGEEG